MYTGCDCITYDFIYLEYTRDLLNGVLLDKREGKGRRKVSGYAVCVIFFLDDRYISNDNFVTD